MSVHRFLRAASRLGAMLPLLCSSIAYADPGLILAMGYAGGQSSDVVVVPLTLHAVGDAPPVAGLDVVLTWDAELAQLDEVRFTTATQEWFKAANITPGRVAISMAALSTATATTAGLPILDFVFTLGESIGQTVLALSDTRVFDLDQQAVEHLTANGGLDVGVVSTPGRSVSAIKETYSRSH